MKTIKDKIYFKISVFDYWKTIVIDRDMFMYRHV